MLKDKTKIALFDWGGIIEPYDQWDAIWCEIATLYGKKDVCLDFENDFYMENTIFETTRDLQITSQVIERYLQRQNLPYTQEDIENFKRIYLEHFNETNYNRKIINFIKKELHPIVCTGIFSNIGILDCIRQAKQTEDYHIFDYQYLSCDMNAMKPENNAFAIVEKDFEPQNIFFVDDNEINCLTARQHGWNVLHSTNSEEIIDFFKANCI